MKETGALLQLKLKILNRKIYMKKIVLFLISLICFTRVFALDITDKSEVSPHLFLVKFEKNLTFIIGEDNSSITSIRTLNPFAMNKYETTYGLWYDVRIKAEKLGYNFLNLGQGGSRGKRGAKPTEKDLYQPVSMISWYDAIVWCNAYSELQGRTPVYTYKGEVLRDSSDTAACDLCVCDFSANGFRLPSESEWEYAARKTNEGFQKGNLVSGQLNKETEDALLYSWTSENASSSRVVGTAGIAFNPDVKVKMGSGNPNASGLFDMSGNVLEYCWDWYGEYKDSLPYGPKIGEERVSRGGSWSPFTLFNFAGDRYSFDPNTYYPYNGFRICCTLTNE